MKTRNRALRAVLPLLALALWLLLFALARQTGRLMTAADLRYSGEQGISPAQVEQSRRYALEDGGEALPAVTLWREEPGKGIADESGLRSAGVTLLTCYGSGETAYPATLRYGAWPVPGDTDGILLSSAAADALLGGMGAVGQGVRLEGKLYYLRGVFEGKEPLALVQDRGDSESLYSRVLVQSKGDSEWMQMFSGATKLDLPFLSWLLTALAALPALVLAGAILLRLLGRGWSLRYSPLLLGQYLLPAVALGGLTLWAAGFPWDIPVKLIPTRFSDLDFWGRLAGEIGEGIKGVLTGAMTARDLALWGGVLSCLLLLPVACAAVLLALRHAKAEGLNHLLLSGLCAMAGVFAAGSALGVAPDRALLALPVLWLAADAALAYHQTRLKPRGEGGNAHETPYQAALGDTGD